MLAIEDVNNMGFCYRSESYVPEVDSIKMLSEAVGDEIIKKAYFENNPELLRQEFEKDYGAVNDSNGRFVGLMTAITKYGNDPSEPNRERVKEIIDDYRRCNKMEG